MSTADVVPIVVVIVVVVVGSSTSMPLNFKNPQPNTADFMNCCFTQFIIKHLGMCSDVIKQLRHRTHPIYNRRLATAIRHHDVPLHIVKLPARQDTRQLQAAKTALHETVDGL